MDKQLLKQMISRYEEATFTVNRRMAALLKEKLGEEITSEQHATLRYIRRKEQCTSSELADIFCVGKSSITAIITRLFDKELIKRIPDDKDRRVTYLALTDKGIEIADRMEEKIQELLGSFIQHFDEQEAIVFIETFEKLARVLVQSEDGGRKSE